MASDVHRQFLFEPNPFVWDQDFRAMKAAGVNLVRTGIWTGWKKFMPEAGKVNEAALRALDAFLLTAHQLRHPDHLHFLCFPAGNLGREECLPRSAGRAGASAVRLGVRAALSRRGRFDFGI